MHSEVTQEKRKISQNILFYGDVYKNIGESVRLLNCFISNGKERDHAKAETEETCVGELVSFQLG